MRAAEAEASQRFSSGGKPQVLGSQQAIHGFPGPRWRQWGQFGSEGERFGLSSIDLSEGWFPRVHPAAAILVLQALTGQSPRIEESRGKPGQATVAVMARPKQASAAPRSSGARQRTRTAAAKGASDTGVRVGGKCGGYLDIGLRAGKTLPFLYRGTPA